MTTRSTPLLLLGAAFWAGCALGPDSGRACTTSIEPGVVVVVRDAVTGDTITAGARGAVHEGAYVDSLRASIANGDFVTVAIAGAPERAGRYRVEVVHPGYRDFVRDGLVVRQGVCHVETQTLVAEMVPVGAAD